MNRRQFFKAVAGVLLVPSVLVEPTRRIFLPPVGGWPLAPGTFNWDRWTQAAVQSQLRVGEGIYRLLADETGWRLEEQYSGELRVLMMGAQAFVPGDRARLDVKASIARVYRDGALLGACSGSVPIERENHEIRVLDEFAEAIVISGEPHETE